jgi:hypothetical protein
MKEKYDISFQKLITPSQAVVSKAISNNEDWFDLVSHISDSDIPNTVSQIIALNKVQNGFNSDGLWGEVFGSSLYIYFSNNTVEIGDGETILPIEDFKELLQEWLAFLNS